MKLSLRFQVLLLVLVVLGVYYPAQFAGELLVDDLDLVSRLDKVVAENFFYVFFPGEGFYYRPFFHFQCSH